MKYFQSSNHGIGYSRRQKLPVLSRVQLWAINPQAYVPLSIPVWVAEILK